MQATTGDLVVIIGRQQIQIETLRAQLRQAQAESCPDAQAHVEPAKEEPTDETA